MPEAPPYPLHLDTIPGIDPGPLPTPVPGPLPGDDEPDFQPEPDADPDPTMPDPDGPGLDPGFPGNPFQPSPLVA